MLVGWCLGFELPLPVAPQTPAGLRLRLGRHCPFPLRGIDVGEAQSRTHRGPGSGLEKKHVPEGKKGDPRGVP